jgi:hypothetical protein
VPSRSRSVPLTRPKPKLLYPTPMLPLLLACADTPEREPPREPTVEPPPVAAPVVSSPPDHVVNCVLPASRLGRSWLGGVVGGWGDLLAETRSTPDGKVEVHVWCQGAYLVDRTEEEVRLEVPADCVASCGRFAVNHWVLRTGEGRDPPGWVMPDDTPPR